MAPDPRSPVIVGVGQHLQRADGLDDALSPVDLIVEAVRAAAADAGAANVISHAQSLRVVQLLSWRYRDPAALVAARLGIQPAETAYTTAGGNTPQSLVNLTAAEILDGTLDCAVLMGGETWRTRMRARRTDAVLTWDKQPDEVVPTRLIGSEMEMNHPDELDRGVVMPVQVYPMFETALRAHRGETFEEHQVRTSELWARFCEVAATNPYAWVRDAKTRRGDPHAGADQPDDRDAVPEVHELEQRRRHVGRGHHVLGREGPRPRHHRGPLGLHPRRRRCSRPRLRVEPRRPPLLARDPDCGPRRHAARRHRDRRRRVRRPLLVLPVGGADRCGGARLRPRPRPRRSPAGCASPAGRGTTTSCTRSPRWSSSCATSPVRSGSCARTAATSRSTRSASTRRRRPADGFRAAHPQDEIDVLPRRELADDGRATR